jgi:hypothetical protein
MQQGGLSMSVSIFIYYEDCPALPPLFAALCDAARERFPDTPAPVAVPRGTPGAYTASFGQGDFYVLRPGGRPACASDLFLPGLLDGRGEPTEAGVYFCACLLYAAVTGRSPEGIPYSGTLSEEDAALWQRTTKLVL